MDWLLSFRLEPISQEKHRLIQRNWEVCFLQPMRSWLGFDEGEEETKWLKECESQCLQQKLRDLDKAICQSFKSQKNRKGFPKFKSKKSDESGIKIPASVFAIDVEKSKLILPKQLRKNPIRIKLHRGLMGAPKSVTIIKDKVGNWYASFVVEVSESIFEPQVKEIRSAVGIDLGIKSFAVTSDGEVIENPKFLRKSEKRLKKCQKKHSRKQKKSRNREKSRKRLAKLHKKVANQRKDFIKQTASLIAKENDLVVCEDLNVKGMVKNHRLAKAVSDVGFGMFLTELKWQCYKRGKYFHQVSRWYPSSKTCNHCGYKKQNLTLSEREWICPQCGAIIDRDYNASLNILEQGLRDLQLVPQELREVTSTTDVVLSAK